MDNGAATPTVRWSARGRVRGEVACPGPAVPSADVLESARRRLPAAHKLILRDATTHEVVSGDVPAGSVLFVQEHTAAQAALVQRGADPDALYRRSPTPEEPELDPCMEEPPAAVQQEPAGDGGAAPLERPKIPRQLLCPVTGSLLVKAVTLPCACQETVNEDCARPGKPCPIPRCGEVLPARLVPDKRVRRMAQEHAEKLRLYEEEVARRRKVAQQRREEEKKAADRGAAAAEATITGLLSSLGGGAGERIKPLLTADGGGPSPLQRLLRDPDAAKLLSQAASAAAAPAAGAKRSGGFRPPSALNLSAKRHRSD